MFRELDSQLAAKHCQWLKYSSSRDLIELGVVLKPVILFLGLQAEKGWEGRRKLNVQTLLH